jgi:aminoglycoside phosphotransferase (APT) family kinase protein
MSRGRTWRVHLGTDSVIVKHTEQDREVAFYTQVEPQIPRDTVPVPHLLWADPLQAPGWLVLEDIPLPFPPERWLADAAQLTVLYQLHRVTLPDRPADVFQPAWTEEMMHAALACFPPTTQEHLRPILTRLQQRYQSLFEPQCWISGDPNPTNWGLRHNGTLVLYDWERFGAGTAAIDLAITCPGFGDWTAFTMIAQRYLECGTHRAATAQVRELADAIAGAKAWTIVEFLSHYQQGRVDPNVEIGAIVEALPGWLDRLQEA